MAISFGIDDYIEGGVITAVILLNIVVGFWQDYRAEKTIESLKKLTAPEATVTRNGTMDIKVRAVDLVPGDIVQLSVGSIVSTSMYELHVRHTLTSYIHVLGPCRYPSHRQCERLH
jgi:magnesium-transporting ATPase (P-type)